MVPKQKTLLYTLLTTWYQEFKFQFDYENGVAELPSPNLENANKKTGNYRMGAYISRLACSN